MSLLVAVTGRNNSKLMAKLQSLLPDVSILEYDETSSQDTMRYHDVLFVLAWNPPQAMWQKLPNLKGISSYGAGVDALLGQAELPSVPVARIVDPNLGHCMSEYVMHAIGYFKLRFNQYLNNKHESLWKPRRTKAGNKVGILGLGQLGKEVGQSLHRAGYEVAGWSQSVKSIEGITCYSGQKQLFQMLASLDYVVCLLPLTAQTQGILNQSLFEQLPQGAVLINVARGAHLNEQDLLDALDSGHLAGAALDVFNTEPLPEHHAFWQQPNVLLTPHISAVTSVDTACEQIADNYQRSTQGRALLNGVDRHLGY